MDSNEEYVSSNKFNKTHKHPGGGGDYSTLLAHSEICHSKHLNACYGGCEDDNFQYKTSTKLALIYNNLIEKFKALFQVSVFRCKKEIRE